MLHLRVKIPLRYACQKVAPPISLGGGHKVGGLELGDNPIRKHAGFGIMTISGSFSWRSWDTNQIGCISWASRVYRVAKRVNEDKNASPLIH